MTRMRFTWLFAALGLLFSASASGQATEGLQTVVLSKATLGRPIIRLPFSLDDSPGHILIQVYRTDDDVSTSDPSLLSVVQEHVYFQAEDLNGARTFKSGYSFFVTPEGDRVFTRWDGGHGAPSGGVTPLESGNVEILGGTGRYSKARGHGSWRQLPAGSKFIEEYVLNIAF